MRAPDGRFRIEKTTERVETVKIRKEEGQDKISKKFGKKKKQQQLLFSANDDEGERKAGVDFGKVPKKDLNVAI